MKLSCYCDSEDTLKMSTAPLQEIKPKHVNMLIEIYLFLSSPISMTHRPFISRPCPLLSQESKSTLSNISLRLTCLIRISLYTFPSVQAFRHSLLFSPLLIVLFGYAFSDSFPLLRSCSSRFCTWIASTSLIPRFFFYPWIFSLSSQSQNEINFIILIFY